MVDTGPGRAAVHLRMSRAPRAQILHHAQRVQVSYLYSSRSSTSSKFQVFRLGI
jgi:hypothetical protein